jgi:hypothetical protein
MVFFVGRAVRIRDASAPATRVCIAQKADDLLTSRIPLIACIHRIGFVGERARKATGYG